MAVVLSIQVANVALTTVVADQSVARTQSPEAVARMALASDVVVVQVSRHLLTLRGRSVGLQSAWQGKGSNSLRRKCSSSLHSKGKSLIFTTNDDAR